MEKKSYCLSIPCRFGVEGEGAAPVYLRLKCLAESQDEALFKLQAFFSTLEGASASVSAEEM